MIKGDYFNLPSREDVKNPKVKGKVIFLADEEKSALTLYFKQLKI